MKGLIYALAIIFVGIPYVAMNIMAVATIPTTLTFLILKLCSVISWGWFYVVGLPLICGIVSAIIVTLINMWAKK